MNARHRADRLLARVRTWWTERRARRDAAWDDEASWLPSLPEDQELGPFNPVKTPGQRYRGPHAEPGDMPDQPAGEGR